MPAEPKQSNFPDKVKHLCYPVREQGGLLFAYLGPQADNPPPLPKYKALADASGRRSLEATRIYDYNWFNFIENGADPVHFSILHRTDPHDGTWRSWFFNYHALPEDVQALFVAAAAHRLVPEAEADSRDALATSILKSVPVD